jgi:hypothetical protein
MPYLLVRHNVMDYVKCKPVYDPHAATGNASGSKGAHLFSNAENPNEIPILFECDKLSNAGSLHNLKT